MYLRTITCWLFATLWLLGGMAAGAEQIIRIAGGGTGGDGGPATQAQLINPYLCDLDNHRIRAMNLKTGLVSTVAGNGQQGTPTDGTPAIAAPLVDPRAIVVDGQGNLYILERSGNALRVVGRDGRIRTLIDGAGHRLPAEIGDLNGPKHLCVDRQNRVLIADTENHRILRYNPHTGQTERIAGTGKEPPANADTHAGIGGSPLAIDLKRPHGVYVRSDGAIFIADSENNRVLQIVR